MSTVASLISASKFVELPANQYRSQETDGERIVRLVRAGGPEGVEQLHALLYDGIRFFLTRSLGPDVETDAACVFSTVLRAIRHGDLRDANGLAGLARKAVRDHVLARRSVAGQNAPHADTIEQAGIARCVLEQAAPRDREALDRFYLQRQPAAQVMSEMGLTAADFAAAKARARARFAELDRRGLAQ